MRRVLIIGTIWPYHQGGARIPGLAAHLPDVGWEPVVLTRSLPSNVLLPYRVEQVGGQSVAGLLARRVGLEDTGGPRRALAQRLHLSSNNWLLTWAFRSAREVLEYPDGHGQWRAVALHRARELVQSERFDAVISSSPPVSAHIIANAVKRQYGVTWVADFPHLWSQDHGVPYGGVRRWFDRRLEIRTLTGADALTSIIEPLAGQLGTLHGFQRCSVIEHGFGPDTLNDPPVPVTGDFTITYTGGWSRGRREPRLFLSALRSLLDQRITGRAQVRVRFYGPPEDWIQEQIEQAGLASVVTQLGVVPQPEAFVRQRESQVLLIPKSEDGLEGMISSKFYEYVAARRPILAIGGHPDVVNEKLMETGAGVSCETVAGAVAALGSFYEEYQQTGIVACNSRMEVVLRYSHREMARQFAALLDRFQPAGVRCRRFAAQSQQRA